MHFAFEDCVLYEFADTYFEVNDCLHKEEFQELIEALMLATLTSFHTDLEQLTMEGLFSVKHPASHFGAVFCAGAIECSPLPPLDEATNLMHDMLFYACAYELRNNLYDYHLDEDKTVTLSNWKEKLQWHYVQYTNVYNLALSSFYAACLMRKMLKKQIACCLSDLHL